MCRLAFAALLAFIGQAASAATYTLEPNYTQGVLRWDHLGFSYPAAQFAQGTGTLEFDAERPDHGFGQGDDSDRFAEYRRARSR